jgi:chromosome segregation ATPase
MDCELQGFRRTLRKTQEESETLLMILNKIENEIEFVKKQTMILHDQKDKLLESYQMYTKSLEQTECELQKLNEEKQAVQSEFSATLKLLQKTIQANQKLEADISESLQSRLAAEKGAQGWKKDLVRLKNEIHEKESSIALTQNELSSVRLETLDYASKIEHLKSQTKKLEEDCSQKSLLIEKYQQEMKRRHDELGKKASEMDSLNKKLEQLLIGEKDSESVGPLEATIRNFSNAIKLKEKECTQASQYWLRAQNELVGIAKFLNETTEDIQDLKMKQSVLSRKKRVVNATFESEEKQIKAHQANIRKLQNDMVKINLLLSKQSNIQSQLEENNLELEQEFRAKLRSSELESIRMEQKIENLKTEKEQALQGLIEAE